MAKRQGVWKRGNIYHYGFVHPTTGEYIRRTSKSTIESIAAQKLTQAKNDADQGLLIASSNSKTVRQLIDWCWENFWRFDEHGADEKTRYGYMKAPLDEFGEIKFDKVTRDTVRSFIAKRSLEVKRKSIELEISSMRFAYNRGIENNMIRDNPFARLGRRLFPKTESSRSRTASSQESELMLGHSAGMLQRIIEFDLNSGLRKGQIENLKWSDVDFINLEMAVATGKGNRYRRYKVPIYDRALEILKSLPLDTEYVFTNQFGKKIPKNGVIHAGFPRLIKRCGIVDFHFHDLRHTFATDLYRKTNDLKYVSEVLGHTNTKTTEIYLNLTKEDMQRHKTYRYSSVCHNYVTKGEIQNGQKLKVIENQ